MYLEELTMRKWILPAAAALALLTACQPEGQAPQEPGANEATPAGAPPVQIADTIHGTVNVNEPIPIDPGSRLDVRLVDVAQPEVVIAQQVFDVGGTPPPFTFDLPLDPARIDPARTYVLNIVLTDGDRRFLPPLSTPVLTGGAGANPQIVLNPEPTPAESMKEAFQKLQAHIGGMKKVDGTFTTDDASVGWDAFADKGNVRFVRVNTVFDAGGRSAVKFAYLDGKPMAVVRQEGGVTTRLGWDPAGAVVLNEKTGGGTLTEEEIAALRASAEEAYTRAQGRVDATRKKRR
jgi:putative lipoprotein